MFSPSDIILLVEQVEFLCDFFLEARGQSNVDELHAELVVSPERPNVEVVAARRFVVAGEGSGVPDDLVIAVGADVSAGQRRIIRRVRGASLSDQVRGRHGSHLLGGRRMLLLLWFRI